MKFMDVRFGQMSNSYAVRTEIRSLETSLIRASATGSPTAIKRLLDVPEVDPNCLTGELSRFTPLLFAASNGRADAVRALLARKDTDVNARCAEPAKWTAIHAACSIMPLDISRALDMDSVFSLRRTDDASEEERCAVLGLLLAHEAIEADAKTLGNETALLCAAANRFARLVDVLLADGRIGVDTPTTSGHTALVEAARNADLETLDRLLGASADVNGVHNAGKTALQVVSCLGHVRIARRLLDVDGIDVNLCDMSGSSALHGAGNADVADALLAAKGIEVNTRDSSGLSPLTAAAKTNRLNVVNRLLEDPRVKRELKDCRGNTAADYLRLAARRPARQEFLCLPTGHRDDKELLIELLKKCNVQP